MQGIVWIKTKASSPLRREVVSKPFFSDEPATSDVSGRMVHVVHDRSCIVRGVSLRPAVQRFAKSEVPTSFQTGDGS